MVELLPRVQALGAESCRNKVKLAVVPEESDRTARVIGVLGRLTPALSALMAGSFQVLILPEKMPAMVAGVELQVAHAGQVVRHRDRADDDGEVQDRLAREARRLLGRDRRVRAGEVDRARGQVGAALAGAAAAVVDGHVGLDRLEGRDGFLLEGESGRSTRSAFSVPLRLAELLDEPPAGARRTGAAARRGAAADDEEHAPRTSAKATAETPAAVTCCLYRSCIFSTPHFSFPAAMSAASDGRSSGKTVCARPVWPRWRYLRVNANMDKRGLEG